MNKIKLNRLNKADHDEFNRMNSEITELLNENKDSPNWMENIEAILDFQDTDGSFKLYHTYKIPSDMRVYYCHEPTYISSAILMKAYLTGDDAIASKVEDPLIQGLEMSCMRGLNGHGYGALKGQINALNIFMKGGVREFIDLYPDLNCRFREMILEIAHQFRMREIKEDFTGPWREDYKEEILEINRYFNSRNVFVYGTLMKGEINHHYLEKSRFLGASSIEGYDMYNVGWYPAIIPGEGLIPGELYEVPKEDISMIDMLEGEGELYIRKCEMTSNKSLAYIYEYAEETEGLERIKSWKKRN